MWDDGGPVTTTLTLPADARRRVAVPLTSVSTGSTATLHDIHDPDARALLRSLGLTDASELRLCKIGDPCIIQVGATRIGLSRGVAASLWVVPAVPLRR
jgi:Fe2+ transport system protein FeoA